MTPTVLRAHLRERWALAALLVAFAVFVIANGGVALGGKMRHPFGRVHVENVIVAAVLFFVLFLPLLLADARRTARRALRSAWVWAGTLMMVAAWWWAFRVDHPFNGDMHYLHNRIADALDPAQPPAGAACAGALVAVGSAALLAWPFAERRFALVLPFFAASLLPAWLIEHRYAIPGLALLLLFRAPASPAAERALLAWLAVLAAAVVLVIRTGVAFP